MNQFVRVQDQLTGRVQVIRLQSAGGKARWEVRLDNRTLCLCLYLRGATELKKLLDSLLHYITPPGAQGEVQGESLSQAPEYETEDGTPLEHAMSPSQAPPPTKIQSDARAMLEDIQARNRAKALRRRGDESVVSREAMRTAINDARHAIGAARAAGLKPADGERLLSEAISYSYRMDYVRARNTARFAERKALEGLEQAYKAKAREDQEVA